MGYVINHTHEIQGNIRIQGKGGQSFRPARAFRITAQADGQFSTSLQRDQGNLYISFHAFAPCPFLHFQKRQGNAPFFQHPGVCHQRHIICQQETRPPIPGQAILITGAFPAAYGKTLVQYVHQFITFPETLRKDHAPPDTRIGEKLHIMRQHAEPGNKTSAAAIHKDDFLHAGREILPAGNEGQPLLFKQGNGGCRNQCVPYIALVDHVKEGAQLTQNFCKHAHGG